MKKNDVDNIIERYLAGTASKQEEAMIETWYLHLHEDLPPFEVSIEDRLFDLIVIKMRLDAMINPNLDFIN